AFDQSKLFPTPGGFLHAPDQSGYFEISCACAANVISAPIASIIDAMRLSMTVLPCVAPCVAPYPAHRRGLLRGDHRIAAPSSPDRRTRLLQPAAEPDRGDAACKAGRVVGFDRNATKRCRPQRRLEPSRTDTTDKTIERLVLVHPDHGII